jgi:hypothetical protein
VRALGIQRGNGGSGSWCRWLDCRRWYLRRCRRNRGGSADVVSGVVQPPFHPVDPGCHAALILFSAGQQDPGAQQLQVQPGGRGPGHFGQGRVGNISGPGKLRRAKVVGLVLQPGYLVRRHPAQDGVGALGHGLHDDQVAEALQQVLYEPAGIVARLDDPVHGAENGGGVRSSHGFHDVVQQ